MAISEKLEYLAEYAGETTPCKQYTDVAYALGSLMVHLHEELECLAGYAGGGEA